MSELTTTINGVTCAIASDVVEELLSRGIDISPSATVMCAAVTSGDLKRVKQLHKRGYDIHVQTDICLTIAVSNSNYKLVKYLLKHGADVNTHNNTAMRNAIINGDLKIAELLYGHGADVKCDRYCLFISACAGNRVNIVHWMCEDIGIPYAVLLEGLVVAHGCKCSDVIEYLTDIYSHVSER